MIVILAVHLLLCTGKDLDNFTVLIAKLKHYLDANRLETADVMLRDTRNSIISTNHLPDPRLERLSDLRYRRIHRTGSAAHEPTFSLRILSDYSWTRLRSTTFSLPQSLEPSLVETAVTFARYSGQRRLE